MQIIDNFLNGNGDDLIAIQGTYLLVIDFDASQKAVTVAIGNPLGCVPLHDEPCGTSAAVRCCAEAHRVNPTQVIWLILLVFERAACWRTACAALLSRAQSVIGMCYRLRVYDTLAAYDPTTKPLGEATIESVTRVSRHQQKRCCTLLLPSSSVLEQAQACAAWPRCQHSIRQAPGCSMLPKHV